MKLLLLLSLFFAGPLYAANAYTCLIEPAQTVELGVPVGGVIERVTVKRGDRVRRNQVVASLDSRAERAATALALYKSRLTGPTQLAQSKVDLSQRTLERRRGMVAEKLMAKQEADTAQSELEQAQAELKSAQEEREAARLEHAHQLSPLCRHRSASCRRWVIDCRSQYQAYRRLRQVFLSHFNV